MAYVVIYLFVQHTFTVYHFVLVCWQRNEYIMYDVVSTIEDFRLKDERDVNKNNYNGA